MGGFLRTLWWIVLFFCLFCAEIWARKCLGNRCHYQEELRLTDCSRAKLKSIPKLVQLVNYTMLNLRYNLLVQANFSVLEEQLPNLKMVNLTDNPLDCKGFLDKTILGVIFDCEITEAVSVKTTKGDQNNSQGELAPTSNDYKCFIITRSRHGNFHNYIYDCSDLNICINDCPHCLFQRWI